jgi:pimeloyl-ACP methyl ester carboxylesterase
MSLATNPVDGIRIAYEDTGDTGDTGHSRNMAPDGEPVVLLHGSGLSRGSWRGLGYIRALKQTNRVVALDLRGHGRSDKPHEPSAYAMPLIVGDVIAVLDELHIPAAHVVGYSLGARTGFSLIDAHPDRALSLVSLGGTFRSLAGSVADVFFADFDIALRTGGMPEFIRLWGESRGRPVDAPTAAAFLANDAEALAAYFEQAGSEAGVDETRLAELTTPTLLMAGTDDPARFADSRLAASIMPNARFVALDGRGHGDTLAPTAPVLAEIRRHLTGEA